jgi:hypothetical protein
MKLMENKDFNNSPVAWICIKISFIFYWVANMIIMTNSVSNMCPFPTGFCKVWCFSFLFSTVGKWGIWIMLILFSWAYIAEKKMWLTTLCLFFLSSIIISHHESNGMFHHATIFSPIFAVQCFAYYRYTKDSTFQIANNRLQYSLQMIVASYMLAGISKISSSGLDWIDASGAFALEIVKNHSFDYYATGNKIVLEQGYNIAEIILTLPWLIKIGLFVSLMLELFSFIALISSKYRVAYAFGLFFMHAGIKVVMGIPFGVIAPIMLIFFLNPLYWLYFFFSKKLSPFLQ